MKRTLNERAHSAATRMQLAKCPDVWSEQEKGSYWYGAFDAYIAGYKAAKRDIKKGQTK